MATVTQQPQTIDKYGNVDYSTILKNAINNKASDAEIIADAQAREAKIKAGGDQYKNVQSTDDLLKSLGYTGAYTTQSNTPQPDQVSQPKQSNPESVASAPDSSGMIKDEYNNLITALKDQVQQDKNNKQLQVDQLPGKYQPMKDDSEVQKANDLRTTLEQAANAGDRGGVGRENALNTQIAGENRLNSINLQQDTEKNSLLNDISNLDLEAAVQSGQLGAQEIKDLIANGQYVDSTNYSRGRDAVADQRYNDETNYNHMRDTITDTGKLADGTYTQSGQLNELNIQNQQIQNSALPQQIKDQATLTQQQIQKGDIDIQTGQAQLKELTDPNSVTNQLAKLNLDTAKLNYAALPQQLKDQAAQVAQDLQTGKINMLQAQATINQIKAQTAQINAETNNLKKGLTAQGGAQTQNVVNFNDVQSSLNNFGNNLYKQLNPYADKGLISNGKESVPYVAGVGNQIDTLLKNGMISQDQANQLSVQYLGRDWNTAITVLNYSDTVDGYTSLINNKQLTKQQAYQEISNFTPEQKAQLGSYYNALLNKFK